MALAMH